MKTINTDAKLPCLLIDPFLLNTPMLCLDVGRETNITTEIESYLMGILYEIFLCLSTRAS